MKKVIGTSLMACIVVVFSSFAFSGANANFGETLTTAQMANMFGGWWCKPNDDCDTTSGSCPGGNTCGSNSDITTCHDCKSGNGKVCGALKQEWGWDCVDGTEDCKDATLGSCGIGVCGPHTSGDDDGDSCGTRPDCTF